MLTNGNFMFFSDEEDANSPQNSIYGFSSIFDKETSLVVVCILSITRQNARQKHLYFFFIFFCERRRETQRKTVLRQAALFGEFVSVLPCWENRSPTKLFYARQNSFCPTKTK